MTTTMTTGDLKNNLRKLQSELRAVKYEKDVDYESLGTGLTAAFLPIYHYMFVDYSRPLAEKIVGLQVELSGKTDLRFMEGVYKVLREMFSYKPPVTKEQFFAAGFGERKVIMCTQVLQLLRNKHQSLVGISRSASGRVRVNQTLPCPITMASSPACHEIDNLTHTVSVLSPNEKCPDSPVMIIPRVVKEVHSAVARESPDIKSSTDAYKRVPVCSSPDPLLVPSAVTEAVPTGAVTRSPDIVDHSPLLMTVNKINTAVQLLANRLGSLDERLVRLESLQQQISKNSESDQRCSECAKLEHRVTRLEQGISDKCAETASENVTSVNQVPNTLSHPVKETVPEGVISEQLTSQLNNLMARMTLAENKLTMLQQGTPYCARFPSPDCASPVLTPTNEDCLQPLNINDQINSADDVVSDSSLPSACDSSQTGVDTKQQSDKGSRLEQLERIQAMLRGTEEMLLTYRKESQSQ